MSKVKQTQKQFKYLMCIDRHKIEKNLKQQHKFGRVSEMNPPIMIVDAKKMVLIENCEEIKIIGDSKCFYSPEEKLPITGVQVTLWAAFNEYKIIK